MWRLALLFFSDLIKLVSIENGEAIVPGPLRAA